MIFSLFSLSLSPRLLIVFITSCQSLFSLCFLIITFIAFLFDDAQNEFSVWFLLKVCLILFIIHRIIRFDGLVIFCLQSMIYPFFFLDCRLNGDDEVCANTLNQSTLSTIMEWMNEKNWIRKWKIDSFILFHFIFLRFVNQFVSTKFVDVLSVMLLILILLNEKKKNV